MQTLAHSSTKMFSFFVLGLIFAFVLQKGNDEISLRYNTNTRIFVIPPDSNTFPDWRRMRHVSWVKTRVNKTH